MFVYVYQISSFSDSIRPVGQSESLLWSQAVGAVGNIFTGVPQGCFGTVIDVANHLIIDSSLNRSVCEHPPSSSDVTTLPR